MYFTYTLILTLGLVLAFPYYLVRFRKYFPTLADRFGFSKLPQLRNSIWVHAVSVGEVKAVERLLERLRQQFPGKPLIVSTATPAGQQLARERRDIVDHTFYFPIDLPWCVRRVVDRVDPEMVIIAETEIWPNFLRACRTRGVRVMMINGRISDKSFARYRLVRRWLRRVFEDYTIIGMQSEMDRQRIEAIGADPQKVAVFGNLKYDVIGTTRPLDNALAALLGSWSQIWIAASTMPGEEDLVLDAFTELRRRYPELKLVIAPRHADRFDAVEEIVKEKGFGVLRRSQISREAPPNRAAERRQSLAHGASRGLESKERESPGGAEDSRESSAPPGLDSTNRYLTPGSRPGLLSDAAPRLQAAPAVLLLDTIGELAAVFQFANVVFMGGSLVPAGGHNVLEPARHRNPIVFGPHMENFRDMSRLFLEAKAARQIENAAQLAPAIAELLSNPEQALELGRNAFAIVQQNTGATDRVLRVLEPVRAGR